jgi:uncharacterized protein (TIGR02265 family)
MAEPSLAQGSMFEALFVRALKPQGAFAEELRGLGYDPARAQPQYPTEVWVACLGAARRHVHGGLETGPAYRALGQAFVQSFLDTLAGKVVAVALPLLGPEGLLKRIPRYLTMGRSDLSWELRSAEPRHWVGRLRDPYEVPADFLGGIIEVLMARLHSPATLRVLPQGPGLSDLDIRW